MKKFNTYLLEKLIINKDSQKSDKWNKEKDWYDPTDWNVDDILCGTAGYSMVLPRFYKIIKKTAKSFKVVRIPGKIVSGHRNGQWEEVADLNGKPGEEFTGRINKHGHVRIDDILVHLWDGKPLNGDDMD